MGASSRVFLASKHIEPQEFVESFDAGAELAANEPKMHCSMFRSGAVRFKVNARPRQPQKFHNDGEAAAILFNRH
jgi:hypothetical protein